MTIRVRTAWVVIMTGIALAAPACSPGTDREATAATADPQPVHIDSVLPIAEEIRRFRAEIGAPVVALDGGAESRDELLRRFLTALEAGDRKSLAVLVITVEEFAYLYYPHTRFTQPPYEMSPALVWFQLDSYGMRGLDRAIARFSGESVGREYSCPEAPEIEGENRVWSNCTVQLTVPDGSTVDVSLFGAILERGGLFKFVSYGNRL